MEYHRPRPVASRLRALSFLLASTLCLAAVAAVPVPRDEVVSLEKYTPPPTPAFNLSEIVIVAPYFREPKPLIVPPRVIRHAENPVSSFPAIRPRRVLDGWLYRSVGGA